MLVSALMLIIVAAAIAYVCWNYVNIKKMNEGTEDMIELASIIRSGARTFVKTEFKMIAVVVVILAAVLSLFIEKTAAISFIMGAVMSSIVCIMGMRSATYANVRTSNKARESKSIGETVKVALCGGSISGLLVQALGMLGMILVIMIFDIDPDAVGGGFLTEIKGINSSLMRISTYSLGCSLVAMFNRVAGGNYTKAADISSDILAKLRHDMPEDDSRVPNVIADFIGDNVNDIAGNCSDLLESFVATMAAGIMIAVSMYNDLKIGNIDELAAKLGTGAENALGKLEGIYDKLVYFPILLAGLGLLGCLVGLGFAQFKKKMSDDPSKELDLATWFSAGITLVLGIGAAAIMFAGKGSVQALKVFGFKWGFVSPWLCVVMGIISGVAIGVITEYYTSTEYKPTRKLGEIATEGEAFVITKGDAIGSRSVLLPVLLIGVALIGSGAVCGTYGIACAALGMLSFVGATVSIDAFGPIADNAGGIAEACHLDPEVRAITDKLDAVGNTTAAIGKGFAIGSAAFATVSLIVAYVENCNFGDFGKITIDFTDYLVVAGGIIGGALVEYFAAMLTDNTIEAARVMADVGDAELSKPGVLDGTVKPDYNMCVELAAKQALKKMLLPSVLALVIPVIGGFIFGVKFVGGLLVGATIVAIPRAIFMGNSGGAFDNAKKYIESGALEGHGKGSAAHKAAVTGDTVGDTRKDVVGVALDIFIKTMSTVANTLAVVIRSVRG
ncbi:MAG: sodium-translocating pyrophosphatase [Clostridia bacterium]|nr:sodium-translocating pyrophosphatase [Clostridia bacterium]MBQ9409836.1 sodium-translocating pyrophosphatase [Clostridia bacterium]